MNTQLVDLTENWGTSVVKPNIQCEREPACSFFCGGGGGGGRGGGGGGGGGKEETSLILF